MPRWSASPARRGWSRPVAFTRSTSGRRGKALTADSSSPPSRAASSLADRRLPPRLRSRSWRAAAATPSLPPTPTPCHRRFRILPHPGRSRRSTRRSLPHGGCPRLRLKLGQLLLQGFQFRWVSRPAHGPHPRDPALRAGSTRCAHSRLSGDGLCRRCRGRRPPRLDLIDCRPGALRESGFPRRVTQAALRPS